MLKGESVREKHTKTNRSNLREGGEQLTKERKQYNFVLFWGIEAFCIFSIRMFIKRKESDINVFL